MDDPVDAKGFVDLADRLVLGAMPAGVVVDATELTRVRDRVRELADRHAWTDAALVVAEFARPGCHLLIGRGRDVPEEPLFGAQVLDGDRLVAEAESDASEGHALLRALENLPVGNSSRNA